MRSALVGTLFCASVLCACGGLVVFDPDGAGGGIDDGFGGAGSVTATQSSSSSSTTQGTGAAAPSIDAEIEAVKFGANCMPVIGPDPMQGSVYVRYENTGSVAGSLSLTQASVVFANAMEAWLYSIELSPTTSGTIPAGEGASVEHAKVGIAGDSSFLCQLCGQTGTVELRFDDGFGNQQIEAQNFELGCAF
jgi:hypothetical protein